MKIINQRLFYEIARVLRHIGGIDFECIPSAYAEHGEEDIQL